MRALRRIVGSGVIGAALLGMLLLWATLRGGPQDLPWTPLDLGDPPGLFTGRKLAGLGKDFPHCVALLDKAGVRYVPSPQVHHGACGFTDGVRFADGGSRRIAFLPSPPNMACPVAAALSVWEWDVIQPAAQRLFGSAVTSIEHLGAYNCRPIAGESVLSEHASADAIDIAAFRLADGRRISVIGDWDGKGPKSAFLHRVRDGACRLFATTLSPDYNPAHRTHLHLDQAGRGEFGGRACR